MIIFLYGQDTYRSKQRLDVLKEEFVKRKDEKGLNVRVFEANDLSADELRKSFLTAGLFAEKRLVVVKGILSEKISAKKEKAGDILDEIAKIIKKSERQNPSVGQAGNIIIFWDQGIEEKKLNSQQKKIFLLLKKEKLCEEFKPLSTPNLKKWIKGKVEIQGFKIDELAVTSLIQVFGNNLWTLNNELEKLTAWKAEEKKISSSDLRKITMPALEQNIWKLVDNLGRNDRAGALKILSDQFQQGVDVAQIITILAHQYRTIIRIKSYLEKNRVDNPYQLAKILSLHPFVCQKAMSQEKNHDLNQLKKTYQQLLKIDLWRKTRNIDPEALLDLLIIKS